MPLRLIDPTYWASLFNYTICRRDRYLHHIYANRKDLKFDKRYLSLFLADVSVSLTLEGIQTSCTQLEFRHPSVALRQLVQKLHAHCRSESDLWDALKAGIFICSDDDEDIYFQVPEWWGPDSPLPTLSSVLQDWETSSITLTTTATTFDDQDVPIVEDKLKAILTSTGLDVNRVLLALRRNTEDVRRTRILKGFMEELVTSSL
ncbi:hypothetical protein NMY22_g10488 [Coprinellus aureogranulatus]|nr:hypothetical protein NMY22_g10488 [Coprinellus aureogranulatus]